MKISVLLSSLLICLTVRGEETLYFAGFSYNSDGILYIESVKQVGDEIHVVTKVSEQGAFAMVTPLNETVTIQGPALLAKVVSSTSLPNEEEPPVLNNELASTEFNLNADDGWVNTNALGWVYMRHYSWVWSPYIGWLYVIPGVLTSPSAGFEPDEAYPIGVYVAKIDKSELPLFTDDTQFYLGLSYWLWSPLHGWMIKSEFSNWFYVFEQNQWLLETSLCGCGGDS